MTPDYEYNGKCHIRFFNCDNMDFMKEVEDKKYDLAIVDPPYGIGFDGNTTANGGIAGRWNGFTNKQHHEKKGWDADRPTNEYFAELKRVSKNQIIWGGTIVTGKLLNYYFAFVLIFNCENYVGNSHKAANR